MGWYPRKTTNNSTPTRDLITKRNRMETKNNTDKIEAGELSEAINKKKKAYAVRKYYR